MVLCISFCRSVVFDVVPIPFPLAFSIMVPLQIMFGLNTWLVIIIGVTGSILGRYVLTLYIPLLVDKIFKPHKNEEVQFLGEKMKEKGWKGQLIILTYSLLPLPTTPLFLAGGMPRIKPIQIIPAFFIGKLISDSIAVHFGKFGSENFEDILGLALSWRSVASLILGFVLICALFFIDWFALLQKKKLKLKLNFKIWK